MNLNQLTGADKSAIVLLSLGEELAGEIFRQMQPSEVKKIGAAMSKLGRVSDDVMNVVLTEFKQTMQLKSAALHDYPAEFLRSSLLLAYKGSVYGEHLAESIASQNYRLRCQDLCEASMLGKILATERPATIALVLSQLEPNYAAGVLKVFNNTKKVEALTALAKLTDVRTDLLEIVDNMLCTEISNRQIVTKDLGGPQRAAAILNAIGREADDILDELGQISPEVSQEISDQMLHFNDLSKLEPNALRELYQKAPESAWTIALRGVSEVWLAALRTALSERTITRLSEDINALDPQPLSLVEEKRQEIRKAAEDLFGEDLRSLCLDGQDEMVG